MPISIVDSGMAVMIEPPTIDHDSLMSGSTFGKIGQKWLL